MSEILAPAGSFDALVAAVRCSADAVYLGAENFNARGNARNFDRDSLKEAVKYCHERNVKVYLTLNTIISDREQKKAEELISYCGEIGIDAFIVQDLSLVEKIKKLAPACHLHASTQMSVQTAEGINFLQSLGFTRAVVPRELTREEIKYLSENTSIELEVFVHGALCMSVSGQCYMSAMLGSRSGNRGLCAQPCRLPFSSDGTGGCDLSLKDNSLVPYLKELDEMGIASFKIEGRMKRPEYVAAAVTSCRNALNDTEDEKIDKALKAVFSRSGFTDGYYTDRRGKDMFGTRNKDDVVAAKDVLGELARLYEKEKPRFRIDFDCKLRENEKISLSGKCEGIKVKILSDSVAEKAIKREITDEDIKEQLSKLGGTQFYAGEIRTDIQPGLSVPLSAINKLRREAAEKITQEILKRNTPSTDKKAEEIYSENLKEKSKTFEKNTYLIFSREEQIPEDLPKEFSLVLPLNISEKVFEKFMKEGRKVSAEMPRGIFGNHEKVERKAEKLFNMGVKRFFCPTIDGAVIAKKLGAEITASFGSNIFNSLSLDMWKKHFADEAIMSPEMTVSQINKIKGDIKTGVICYGKLPLMLTRNCPMVNSTSCDKCRRNGELTDRKGFAFSIDCSSGSSEVLNSVPLYMCDELHTFESADFFVLKFTKESEDECREIISKYLHKEKYEGKFTRGLYLRGVI
ncbi:MAG: U32 family peptidase [Clostridia bacterium]|nr:U32 family peptidase [Clostridia bacterium]